MIATSSHSDSLRSQHINYETDDDGEVEDEVDVLHVDVQAVVVDARVCEDNHLNKHERCYKDEWSK